MEIGYLRNDISKILIFITVSKSSYLYKSFAIISRVMGIEYLNNFFTRNIQTKIRNVYTYENNEQSNEL